MPPSQEPRRKGIHWTHSLSETGTRPQASMGTSWIAARVFWATAYTLMQFSRDLSTALDDQSCRGGGGCACACPQNPAHTQGYHPFPMPPGHSILGSAAYRQWPPVWLVVVLVQRCSSLAQPSRPPVVVHQLPHHNLCQFLQTPSQEEGGVLFGMGGWLGVPTAGQGCKSL
jgi:hypothetical protein